jgi:PAS domain S-box-containing protein
MKAATEGAARAEPSETNPTAPAPVNERTTEELRRSEERFRILVEAVGDYAIYLLDPEGHVATWNSGAEKIKGYSAGEIIGQHYSRFFTPEDARAGRPQEELRIARTVGRYEEEGWRVRKDGTRFWSNVVLTAIRDARGALSGFAKVTRDLTERRASEENARELIREQAARAAAEYGEMRLREEHERYRALSHRLQVILEGVADGITVQDRSGKLLFANTAGAQMCGCATVEELLEMPVDAVVARFELQDEHGNPLHPANLPGRRVLVGEPAASALVRVRDVGANRWWWSFIRSTGVGGTPGEPELAINVWHDVTAERRREERERQLARATGSLSTSLDQGSMLSSLAAVLVGGLADYCAIHLPAATSSTPWSPPTPTPTRARAPARSSGSIRRARGSRAASGRWSDRVERSSMRT